MNQRTRKLVLGGLMVALGTALSFLKIYDLPYGGSVTLCSMLPVMVYAYLCGAKWGLGAGFTFSVLQLLFGLGGLKGISGWTVLGSIFLDYLLAFTFMGLACAFKKLISHGPTAFALGALLACLLRYISSWLSGWVLWAQFMEVSFMQQVLGAWFPGAAAVLQGNSLACAYSAVYNAMYMLPETIVTCIAAFLVMQLAGKPLAKLTEQPE